MRFSLGLSVLPTVVFAVAVALPFQTLASVDLSTWNIGTFGGRVDREGQAVTMEVYSLAGTVAWAASSTPLTIHSDDVVTFNWGASFYPGLGTAYIALYDDPNRNDRCVDGLGCGVWSLSLLPNSSNIWNGRFYESSTDAVVTPVHTPYPSYLGGQWYDSFSGSTMTLVFANDYVGRIGFLLAGSSVSLGPFASSAVTISNLSIQPIGDNVVPEPNSALLAVLALGTAAMCTCRMLPV